MAVPVGVFWIIKGSGDLAWSPGLMNNHGSLKEGTGFAA